jgi:hypothetical protein
MSPVDLKSCVLPAQITSDENSSQRNLTKNQNMLLISPTNNFESSNANSNKEGGDFDRNLTSSTDSVVNNNEQNQLTLNSENTTVNEYVSSSSISTSSLSPLSDLNNSSNGLASISFSVNFYPNLSNLSNYTNFKAIMS